MIKTFDKFIEESYNNLGFIKSRSNYYLINESQESKSQSEAVKLVMHKLGWDRAKADNFIRVDLRNDITPLRDKQIGKFTLGITRMYLNNEITDANIISDINATLKLLTAHLNEYDRNLNGLSAEELISKFKRVRENNVKKEKQEINRIKFGVSDYEIVKIDSFNDAKKYYEYTNPDSRWCLTHMEDMYSSYTCDGINQIYFCLKHGFEDIEPDVGENAPLDEYGLSMLSIIVNEEGELAYCTTRWNHDNEGSDSAMNAVEISEVVNVNFYEVFKPNTKWKDMINNAKSRLSNGESPEKIFDRVSDFKDGCATVSLNKKYNIINKNGEILSDKWFDYASDFENGCATVSLNKKYNLINKNGEFLLDKWFDRIFDFKDGYAKVMLNDKYNFINKNGEILLDKWFDYVSDFEDDCATVSLNKKYNIINKNGKFLLDKWFDRFLDFRDGYAIVSSKDGQNFNFINKNGEFLLDKWFDHVDNFKDGCAIVLSRGKRNLINKNGEFLLDKWLDRIFDFKDGYAIVSLNDKYNFINKNGEFLLDKWFDSISTYIVKNGYKVELNGYAIVGLNSKYNIINKNGEILSDKWFDSENDAYEHINNF